MSVLLVVIILLLLLHLGYMRHLMIVHLVMLVHHLVIKWISSWGSLPNIAWWCTWVPTTYSISIIVLILPIWRCINKLLMVLGWITKLRVRTLVMNIARGVRIHHILEIEIKIVLRRCSCTVRFLHSIDHSIVLITSLAHTIIIHVIESLIVDRTILTS